MNRPSTKTAVSGGVGALVGAAMLLALQFIGDWEGLELKAYRDIVGVWTICYGETRGVEAGDTATKAECDTQLAVALKDYNDGLNRCLTAPLPDKVRVAFVSWAYNVGLGNACGRTGGRPSTLVRKANAGDLRGACDQLLVWNRAGGRVVQGLTNRRKAEHALCLEGLG